MFLLCVKSFLFFVLLLLKGATGVPFTVLVVFVGSVNSVKILSIELEKKQIDIELFKLLEGILLSVKAGKSIQSALLEYSLQSNRFFNKKLLNLRDSVFYKPHFSSKKSFFDMDFYFLELEKIAEDGFAVIERLEFLKSQLKQEIYFRRRSSEMWFLTRIQVSILVVLYLFFLFWSGQWDDFSSNDFVLPSFVLFLCGLFGIFCVSRVLKWN